MLFQAKSKRAFRGLILTGLALAFGLSGSALAESTHGLFLPESISEEGDRIDQLFWWITGLTGIVFIGTEGLLLLFIVKYKAKEGQKAHYSHGNHKAEVLWTAIPAVVLLILAVVQFGLWADLKDPERFPTDEDAVEVHVMAKQFEWLFRYPGPDGTFGTEDDYTYPKLVVPKDRAVLLSIRSIDVIHSLYLPPLRFKQDATPGLTINSWFRANKAGTYEIACAELCGASHYKMSGICEILESEEWEKKNTELSKANSPIDYESSTEFFKFWPPSEFK